MDITRIALLEEILRQKEAEKRKYSHWQNGLQAEKGYEQIFEDRLIECDLLRDMIREEQARSGRRELVRFVLEHEEALRRPEVRERLRQWQQDIMDGKTPGVAWADRQEAEDGMEETAAGEDGLLLHTVRAEGLAGMAEAVNDAGAFPPEGALLHAVPDAD